MDKVDFAVTGLNATDNPAPGIAVIRSIRHDPAWQGMAIGLAYDSLDTGVYDPELCDRVYLIPYPTQGGQAVLERIRAIHQRSPFRVLLPNLDSELTNFIQLQHELDGLGIKMLLPGEEQLAMRSKVRLGEFAHAHGIPFPLSLAIATPEKLNEAVAQLGLPIVIKGCFYEAQVCHTVEHAHTAYWSIANRWGLPVVAQTYMPGEEYDICALGDREGRLSGAVAMRKLRLTDKGKAWAGITIRDAELLELTRQVIEGLDWVGPAEIEFIRSRPRRSVPAL